MKHWKAHLTIAALILAAGTILGGILAKPVWAQVRAALVKDVDNPSRQPFAAENPLNTFGAGSIESTATLLTVPAGKRAVIEHVSCINYLEAGNNFVRMELRFRLGGVDQTHQFVNTRVGVSLSPTLDVWSFSQPIRAYADPSTAISIYAIRRSTSGLGGIDCQISGHYVDTGL